MEDHDQRLKTLFQVFFAELLDLFFTKWAKRLDTHKPVWLDKEVFPNPPDGHRRVLDLLAKVPIQEGVGPLPGNPKELLALVHVEIESAERTTVATEQLWQAYSHLRGKYRMPVLPVAVYLNVGLDGIGVDEFTETFDDLEVVRFRYLYAGLRGLDALEYLKGQNLLGVGLSSLMRVPADRAPELGAIALERIAQSALDDQRKYLLAECVESYLPLDEAGRQQFEKLIGSSDFKGAMVMNKSSRELGREDGAREMLTEQLKEKFGELPEAIKKRLQTMNVREITQVGKAMIGANSLNELGLEA